MTGMKSTRKLINAWALTGEDSVLKIGQARIAAFSNLPTDTPIGIKVIITAIFDDAIDLAKSKEQKTEAAS
jgi:hypothetical protein